MISSAWQVNKIICQYMPTMPPCIVNIGDNAGHINIMYNEPYRYRND